MQRQNHTGSVQQQHDENTNKHPVLPIIRFCNLCIVLFLVDVIVSTSLWLAAGDSEYLKEHVLKFDFCNSVHDLVILSLLRSFALGCIITKLENTSLQTLHSPYEDTILKRKRLYYLLAIITAIVSFVYSVVKGVFVYLFWRDNRLSMHKMYYAVVIASIVFSFMELPVTLSSRYFMKKLLVYVLKQWENESNGELNEKKVDLRRLISLARSVSGILYFYWQYIFVNDLYWVNQG